MKSTLVETHANQDEEGGGDHTTNIEWLQKGKAKETTPPIQSQSQSQSLLELRLGISSSNNNNNDNNNNNNNNNSSSNKYYTSFSEAKGDHMDGSSLGFNGFISHNNNNRWFITTPNPSSDQPTTSSASGFIHPWSLAARQKAAALEQASPLSLPRVTLPLPPPIVGWPPIRACRRNLVAKMDGERDAKKAKLTEESGEGSKNMHEEDRAPKKPTMYVKVNMEGFFVGRKINLMAHDSYESLSRALQKMCSNFLSINYANSSEIEEEDEVLNTAYVLLYEDHEGDRMLVGDVPWELFISSVKRLYVAHSPKERKTENEKRTAAQEKN